MPASVATTLTLNSHIAQCTCRKIGNLLTYYIRNCTFKMLLDTTLVCSVQLNLRVKISFPLTLFPQKFSDKKKLFLQATIWPCHDATKWNCFNIGNSHC